MTTKHFLVTLLTTFPLLAFIALPSAHAKDLGVVGATYSIAETDALTEIENRLKAIDWNKNFGKDVTEKLIKNYEPPHIAYLPPAKENRVFMVDMTYTLEMDIPDGKGGILYPKGYTFNPLDYLAVPSTYVFIDGDDKNQVKWFKNSEYAKSLNTRLLFTNGSYSKVSKELKIPVFYANALIIARFSLKAVPSVVRQKGAVMEVKEIDIGKKN